MSERLQPAEMDGARSRAPRQKRSAKTEDRLLNAAVRVLDRDGFDGTTVPGIAAEAKLSPASIYRRFEDKDDLLRVVLLRTLAAQKADTEDVKATLAKSDLAGTAEALVGLLMRQRRTHPQLLRGVTRTLESEPGSTFAKNAQRLLRDTLELMADTLLRHRDNIRHPDPIRAARFAIVSAMNSVEAASPQGSLWRGVLGLSEKAFTAELARQMVAYLRRKP